jgi:hypothetical protein
MTSEYAASAVKTIEIIKEDRDLFSAFLGLHVRTQADGVDRLDLQAAQHRLAASPRHRRVAEVQP